MPAYNEESEIESAIQQLNNQTYTPREIIVVDDGSTDSTFNKALSFLNAADDTRVIRGNHGGPSFARNFGAKESRGEILFFGECDCVYNQDYVEKAVEALSRDQRAGAVCLTGGPLKLRSTLATDCIELENILQHKLLNAGKRKPFYAWVYRRKVFDEIGGFDEKLFQAEDRDLFKRVVNAGYEIAWVPGINWRHKRVETLGELAKKWVERGRTRVLFVLKNRLSSDLARSLIPFWVFMVGIVTGLFYPFTGVTLMLLVLAVFVFQAVRIERIVWTDIKYRRILLEYPIFLLTRNFSTALGYTLGTIKAIILKLQKRQITYRDV